MISAFLPFHHWVGSMEALYGQKEISEKKENRKKQSAGCKDVQDKNSERKRLFENTQSELEIGLWYTKKDIHITASLNIAHTKSGRSA